VENEYARRVNKRSGFQQRVRHPPAPIRGQPRAELSQPFASPVADGNEDGEEPNPKKRRKRVRIGEYRMYRVRLIPTLDQRRELKRCFGAARHAYNWFVNKVQNDGERPNEYAIKKAYRAAAAEHPTWTADVNSMIKAGGINDAANAYKSNFEKRKKNPSHTFEIKYRSHRKNRTEVIHIDGDGDALKKQSPLLAFKPLPFTNPSTKRAECAVFFGSNLCRLGAEERRPAESDADRRARCVLNAQLESIDESPIPEPKPGPWRNKGVDGIRAQDKPHVIAKLLAEGRGGNGDGVVNACKLHWDKRKDTFHLLYTYELPPAAPDPDPSFMTKRIAATDPGVRSFQTWYSPTSGDHGELLAGMGADLDRRCAKLDALQSFVATRRAEHVKLLAESDPTRKRTARQRGHRLKRIKRQEARERCRLRDWVGAGHYAAANFLLGRHDLIVAPQLAVANMVPRNGRVFGSEVARAMLTWSHGLFAQRLHSAAYRYSGRHVRTDTGEPGTSKTCGGCGRWHADLGGNKTFVCPNAACGLVVDRDLNGARNNWLAAYGRARNIGWDGVAH
jgi:putative transposase